MARILTVRERAMRTIQSTLQTITTKNGYNTDVKHVRRLRQYIAQADDPPEIHMVIDEKTQVEKRGTEDRLTNIPLRLAFYTKVINDNSPDTEYNLFLGDIQRVMAQPIWDNSGVGLGGIPFLVDIRPTFDDEAFYWDGAQGTIIGTVNYQVRLTWCNLDPRSWGAGDKLVPE
jgi:hypothetical protein